MADEASADLVARWRNGDQDAAHELFQRYANRLIGLARSRISAKLAPRIDPEDVVQSAYRSFFIDTRDGRFDVKNGGDLWQLLVTITLHKLQRQVQRFTAQKRAVGREQNFGSEDSLHGIQAEVLRDDPSPVDAVALVDEVEALMRRLDPEQRRYLELRLKGCKLDEIAAELGCTERTVRRNLEQIKQQLEQEHGGE
jgi:RNA polymerase sigma-70 factor (ECF subfamily)